MLGRGPKMVNYMLNENTTRVYYFAKKINVSLIWWMKFGYRKYNYPLNNR